MYELDPQTIACTLLALAVACTLSRTSYFLVNLSYFGCVVFWKVMCFGSLIH